MTSNAPKVPPSLISPNGDRTRLLPFNRRIRHICGISLRNLAWSPNIGRTRGTTIDDEVLPYSLQTPTKALATSETPVLPHSLSFSDLKTAAQANGFPKEKSSASRPTLGGTRAKRSSTLDWTNWTPRQRQKHLKDAVSHRSADVFFSLHYNATSEPIYVSELLERVMNADFRHFELTTVNAFIRRLQNIKVRFWARSSQDTAWMLLLEVDAHLRSLQYLGKKLEDLRVLPSDNTVYFFLTDGIYMCPTENLDSFTSEPYPRGIQDSILQPTSSYDDLQRLLTLEDSVQGRLLVAERFKEEINHFFAEDRGRSGWEGELDAAKESLAVTRGLITAEHQDLRGVQAKLEEARAGLAKRRMAIEHGIIANQDSISQLGRDKEEREKATAEHNAIQENIVSQRRRACEDLLRIYPVEPIPSKSLAFTIRHLPLSNSSFPPSPSKESIDVTSAALGHVAHVVYLLSHYLSSPLPYPLELCSSSSQILDTISLMAGSRTFPLHQQRGSIFYRFEYGVFLLNKNIEALAVRLGLHVLDIRQTLPNLKYILFVATAGQGELPNRKAGGVRGLLRDKARESEKNGTPASSRRGSNESGVNAGEAEALRRRVLFEAKGKATTNESFNISSVWRGTASRHPTAR